jgi:hypothetical protein
MSERAYRAVRRHKTLNPHELLFYWANGIEIAGLKPDPAQQIYCAVASANYYAPKLSNVEIKTDVRVKAVISAAPMTQHQWASKYLNQQSNTVSPTPLPDVVPTVAYEVAPTDPSLVQQNNNSGEVIAEPNNVLPGVGGERDVTPCVESSESVESSKSVDPPAKS